MTDNKNDKIKKFYDPLKKCKALTMSNLYEVASSDNNKEKTIKMDNSILQRLIISSEAGRQIDLSTVLKHELMPVPISMFDLNGKLRTCCKSLLFNELTKNVECPQSIPIPTDSTLIIDGMAYVQMIGVRKHLLKFCQYAEWIMDSILKTASEFNRVDVVFDRYYEQFIKCCTRAKRQRGPLVRRMVSAEVPLPEDWNTF